VLGREIAHPFVKAQRQHGQQRFFLGTEGAPLAHQTHEPEAAVAARYRHGKSFRPSMIGTHPQSLAADQRQAPVTPQFRPGEREMTSSQGIDQGITLDQPGIDIEFAERVRPPDGVEDRPLQVREIDFTARKSADLEGRECFTEDNGAGLRVARCEDRGNRVGKRRKGTGLAESPPLPAGHIQHSLYYAVIAGLAGRSGARHLTFTDYRSIRAMAPFLQR
jgi:hypothetical protein